MVCKGEYFTLTISENRDSCGIYILLNSLMDSSLRFPLLIICCVHSFAVIIYGNDNLKAIINQMQLKAKVSVKKCVLYLTWNTLIEAMHSRSNISSNLLKSVSKWYIHWCTYTR